MVYWKIIKKFMITKFTEQWSLSIWARTQMRLEVKLKSFFLCREIQWNCKGWYILTWGYTACQHLWYFSRGFSLHQQKGGLRENVHRVGSKISAFSKRPEFGEKWDQMSLKINFIDMIGIPRGIKDFIEIILEFNNFHENLKNLNFK